MTDYEKLALELKNEITEKDKEKIYDIQSFVFTELEIFLKDIFNKHQVLFLNFLEKECSAEGYKLLGAANNLMLNEIRKAVTKGVTGIVFEETYDYAYVAGYSKAREKMEGKNE